MISGHIQLLDSILADYRGVIGSDFAGYRNHVYRMVNFCFALNAFEEEERQKIIIAGSFHDVGIWTANTFDYLPPSVEAADGYLARKGLASWSAEIGAMIDQHHSLRSVAKTHGHLVEAFRKGDLVDFSLGYFKCGVPRDTVKAVKAQFPNAGFHKNLVKVASRWICQHPFNPVPVLKW